MDELTSIKCVPCEGGVKPMMRFDEEKYLKKVPKWELVDDGIHKIKRRFKFENFKQAMEFVNKVAGVAEEEGHHPDIYIFYNVVELQLYTHAIKGLFLNDFIIAAKADELYGE